MILRPLLIAILSPGDFTELRSRFGNYSRIAEKRSPAAFDEGANHAAVMRLFASAY